MVGSDTWKEFEHNAISHSAAHHLMAIDSLVREHGYARVSDVARLLNITRGSVSISLKPLKVEGLVDQDENKFIRLSKKGQHLVDILLARRKIIIEFLSEVLGVGKERAEVDGCKIEHLLSAESSLKLTSLLRFLGKEEGRTKELAEGVAAVQLPCDEGVDVCPICDSVCLAELVSSGIGKARSEDVAGESSDALQKR